MENKVHEEFLLFTDVPFGDVLIEVGQLQKAWVQEFEECHNCTVTINGAKIDGPLPTEDSFAYEYTATWSYTYQRNEQQSDS